MATGTFYPAAAADTALWRSNGEFSSSYPNFTFGYAGPSYNAFVRCALDIPPGMTISSAALTVTAFLTGAGDCPVTIHVALADNPTAPTNSTLAEALVLSDGLDWSPPDFTADTTYTTPSLVDLIQQIVDRPGWASGNNVLLVLKGTEANTNFRTGRGVAQNVPAAYPALAVEWSDAPPEPVDPTDYEVTTPASLAITTFGPEIFSGQSKVFAWEGDKTLPFGPFTWRSKLILLPAITNFTAARIEAEYSADQAAYFAALAERLAILARNAARISAGNIGGEIAEAPIGTYTLGGDSLEAVPDVGAYSGPLFLRLKVYADGVLKQTVDIFSSKPFRLKGGYRSKQYSFQIEGNIAVKKVEIATSIGDLVEA